MPQVPVVPDGSEPGPVSTPEERRAELAAALTDDVIVPVERGPVIDALLPVVDRMVQAAAAEELRAAADWAGRGAAGRPGPLRLFARKLRDRADALDPS